MKYKRPFFILSIIIILLLTPWIVMQFTDEVNWTIFDFMVAGILLLGAGLLVELIIRKVKDRKFRIALFIVLLILFIIIWAELAVGIFGTSIGGN